MSEGVDELHSHKSDDDCNGWDVFYENEISSLCYILFPSSGLYFNPFKKHHFIWFWVFIQHIGFMIH